MRPRLSEKLLIEEVSDLALKAKTVSRGMSIGFFIKAIRKQLGMSQKVLAKKSHVPQSTISRFENDGKDIRISTLDKILKALYCEVLLLPLLKKSIEEICKNQEKKQAKKQVQYLIGTMNLEKQKPDEKFVKELLKEQEEKLLKGSRSKLWEEASNTLA